MTLFEKGRERYGKAQEKYGREVRRVLHGRREDKKFRS